ncbi:abscisic acid receptor PYL12 [Capsicum galapagoense]
MTSALHPHHINHHTTTTTLTGNFHNQQQQPTNISVPDNLFHYHTYPLSPNNINNRCCSVVVLSISASINTVWSILRRFDNPQGYKNFLKSCHVIVGDGKEVGSLREVNVISGLPATKSIERLEILDDEKKVMSISIVGGDHRLNNYRSVTTLHRTVEDDGDGDRTMVVESYVVDVPQGNTKEETIVFVDTIVRCNLQSLVQIAENLEKNKRI